MPEPVSDRHREEYHAAGYTVFRGVVPPSLVADLRRAAENGRAAARARLGPQAQRFQPVSAYNLDPRPFAAFRDLPALRSALALVLTPRHTFGDPDLLGVLVEPADLPYCTRWHRDWRDNQPHLDLRAWEAAFSDLRFFNQSNCALYEDHSLWVVPGSHSRQDLPEEAALFPHRPIPAPELEGLTPEQRERRCAEYARRMPGAVQVHLDAGDFALYRNTLWHLGSYVPYCRRATLHDVVDTPEYAEWRSRAVAEADRRRAAGRAGWEWSRGEQPDGPRRVSPLP